MTQRGNVGFRSLSGTQKEVGTTDIYIAGFECQDLSTANCHPRPLAVEGVRLNRSDIQPWSENALRIVLSLVLVTFSGKEMLMESVLAITGAWALAGHGANVF